MKKAIGIALLLLAPLFVPLRGMNGASKSSRESLTNIVTLEVLIEDLSPESEAAGLSRDQITTDVELRLRKSGIKVREQGQGVKPTPILYVNAHLVMAQSGGSFVYTINVSVEQDVKVIANDRFCLASTWSSSKLGLVGHDKIARVARDVIGDLVDEFLNDYLSVNPK
jgi:hypothetical protein